MCKSYGGTSHLSYFEGTVTFWAIDTTVILSASSRTGKHTCDIMHEYWWELCFCQSMCTYLSTLQATQYVRYLVCNILAGFRSINFFSFTDYVYFTRRKTFIICTLSITLFRWLKLHKQLLAPCARLQAFTML